MAIITQAARTPGSQGAVAPEQAVREPGRRVVMQSRTAGRVAQRPSVGDRAGAAAVPMRRVGRMPARVRHVHVSGSVRTLTPRGARVRQCASPAAPSMHGSRLTRRGRVVVALIWAALVVLAMVPIVQSVGGGHVDTDAPTVPVHVEAGETLWQVARDVDPAADPRPLVEAIIEINGLRSGDDINPGDTLLVPVSDG